MKKKMIFLVINRSSNQTLNDADQKSDYVYNKNNNKEDINIKYACQIIENENLNINKEKSYYKRKSEVQTLNFQGEVQENQN